MEHHLTLGDLIENPQKYQGWIYLKNDDSWSPQTRIVIYQSNLDLSPEDEAKEREALKSRGFNSTISTDDVEEIVENTNEQLANATQDDFAKAMKFFYDNDAFIEW